MSICNSERNRFASIWVIFCAYIVYSSSEWHALGFLCDNASIPMRLLLKYLGDFENKRGNNSSRGNHDDRWKRKVKGGEDEDEDDRGEDDEEDEDDDGEEEEEKLKNKDKDEEEMGNENSDNSNRRSERNSSSPRQNRTPGEPERTERTMPRYERKLAPTKDMSAFENHSVTGYNPEEEVNLRDLLGMYHASGLDDLKGEDYLLKEGSTYAEEYNIRLGGEAKPNKKSGQMAGKAVGIVATSVSQICAWCWNFCSEERMKANALVDVHREIAALDSDHSMTVFIQKFFPPPHCNRDFLLRQVWKRADEHTVFVYMYDDKSSSHLFNETFYRATADGTKETRRASLKSILVLQEEIGEEIGEDSKGAGGKNTKVSQLCVMDLNGKMDDSLTLGALKSCMKLINELQAFFPSRNPGGVLMGNMYDEKCGPNALNDHFSDTLSMNSTTSTTIAHDVHDLHKRDVNLAGFQCLLNEAENVSLHSDSNRLNQQQLPDSSKSESPEHSPSDSGKTLRSDGQTTTDSPVPSPRQSYTHFEDNDEEGGGFVFWLIKNRWDMLLTKASSTNAAPSTASDKKIFEMEEVRDIRLLYRNAEFKDTNVEKDYNDYFSISQMRNLELTARILFLSLSLSFATLLYYFVRIHIHQKDQLYQEPDNLIMGQQILILSLTLLICLDSLYLIKGLKQTTDKDGYKFLMLGVHLLSGLVFGLKLVTERIVNNLLFSEDDRDQQERSTLPSSFVYVLYASVWLSSQIFLSITSSVQPRVAKPHLLVHSLIILLRLASITDDRNYTWVLHRMILPTTMMLVCFFYNQVQDTHLRSAFKTLYINFNEEYNYRVGRFNSAYNQQQMEDIQIASNQFRDGYQGRDISFEELEFQKQIGQGAMCTVHMAIYRNKIVAVRQLIMSQINRYSAANFVSEMCLLSKLSHPNIICLYGVVQFNSTTRSHLSMVLEYASEGSVYDYLRAHESVDWQGYKRDISLGIATGMLYLHSMVSPILHRDLKTSNCLVTEWREVKICDFGACCYLHSKDTPEMSEIIGSKYHMSPEMLSGDKYDEKTDVFSFGSVLADIGMGGNLQKLFLNRPNGPKAFDFNEFIIRGWSPPLPNAWTVEMPIIADLIGQCWSKDPKNRPTFRKIKSTLRHWSGKLTRKLNESAVLRATTEYTEEENRLLKEDINISEQLNVPPENLKLDKQNSFLLQRKWFTTANKNGRTTWEIHIEKTLSFPSWEVLDFIIDVENTERMNNMRTRGIYNCKVLQMENEHNKVVTTSMMINSKKFTLISKMMWKEVTKDYFFLSNKHTNDPACRRKVDLEAGASYLNVSDTMSIQGSPDGESCHIIINRRLKDPQMIKLSNIEPFNSLSIAETEAIEVVLKKRRLQKIVNMQKLGERAQRYKRGNGFVDLENYEVSMEITDFTYQADKTVDTNQPWISSKAMDQEYRRWKKRNRVMTGGSEEQIKVEEQKKKEGEMSMGVISE